MEVGRAREGGRLAEGVRGNCLGGGGWANGRSEGAGQREGEGSASRRVPRHGRTGESLFFCLISSKLTRYLAYGCSDDHRSSLRSQVRALHHARRILFDGEHGAVPPMLQVAQQVRIQ